MSDPVNVMGLIGGSGLLAPPELETQVLDRSTPYGQASGPIVRGNLSGRDVVFLPRHGTPRRHAPHSVNYRANIWKLREQGVDSILAISCVGAINPDIKTGDFVVPDQLIDYTYGREHCFENESDAHTGHFDFSDPFDESLGAQVIGAVEGTGQASSLKRARCYGATQGPRFETAAEVRRMARDGCDIVGMTLMPEATLAKQAGLGYAALCPVVNLAAGCGAGPVDIEELLNLMASFEPRLRAVVIELAKSL